MNIVTILQIFNTFVVVALAVDRLLIRVFAKRPKVVAALTTLEATIEKDAPIVQNVLVSSTRSDETPVTKVTTKELQ